MLRRALLPLALCLLAWQAQAAYVLKQHSTCVTSAGGACTTSAADFTGVDLIVVAISYYNASSGTSNPSDSSSNTYSTAKSLATGSMTTVMSYVQAPTVTSSMTFTASATGGNTYPALTVEGFSGSAATPLDQTNSATSHNSAGPQTPGSITPSANNELVVTQWGCSMGSGGPSSGEAVGGGFTITDTQHATSTLNWGNSLAYLIQTTATAANPSWSWTSTCNADVNALIASFQPFTGGGGGGGALERTKMGVGK